MLKRVYGGTQRVTANTSILGKIMSKVETKVEASLFVQLEGWNEKNGTAGINEELIGPSKTSMPWKATYKQGIFSASHRGLVHRG